jgi:hypothetical protein
LIVDSLRLHSEYVSFGIPPFEEPAPIDSPSLSLNFGNEVQVSEAEMSSVRNVVRNEVEASQTAETPDDIPLALTHLMYSDIYKDMLERLEKENKALKLKSSQTYTRVNAISEMYAKTQVKLMHADTHNQLLISLLMLKGCGADVHYIKVLKDWQVRYVQLI